MKKFIPPVLLILISVYLTQCMNAQKLNGTYRLQGMHDMASAFHFTPDGKFEFFSMYGAIDRHASGSYTVEGNTLKLHSDKVPGKDFPVTAQSKKGKGYTIQVNESNAFLLPYAYAAYVVNGVQQSVRADDAGLIRIEHDQIDSIYMAHELYADIASLIKDKDNTNNYFEVKLSPTLAEVSFRGIDFTIEGDELRCIPSYVLPFDNIRFVKDRN